MNLVEGVQDYVERDDYVQVKVIQEGSFWDARELVYHSYKMDFMTMAIKLTFASVQVCDNRIRVINYFTLKPHQVIK